jgi:hypothetical protein
MDIYHTGKEEANDDHKFVNERLLEVAVPEDPGDGRAITLEDCLETYFNNRIEVRRYLERRNTLQPLRSKQSIDSCKGHAVHLDIKKPNDSLTMTPLSLSSPAIISPQPPLTPPFPTDHKAPSIVKEYFISEKCDSPGPSPPTEGESYAPSRRRAGSLRKVPSPRNTPWSSVVTKCVLSGNFDACLAVLLAHTYKVSLTLRYLMLIYAAWYTDTKPTNTEKPSNDAQVAAHFSSTRPILGSLPRVLYLHDNFRSLTCVRHLSQEVLSSPKWPSHKKKLLRRYSSRNCFATLHTRRCDVRR